MSRRVDITWQEHGKLIRHSAEVRQPISTSFGAGAVWLTRDADGEIVSKWALPLLAEWRGQAFSNGAGI